MDDLAMAKPARFVARRSAWHHPAVASSRGGHPTSASFVEAPSSRRRPH